MNESATLRRQIHLIRFLGKPYTYPSLEKVLDHLRHSHDMEQVSTGTFERDLRNIRAFYNITITYDRQKRGYFLDLADDENLDDFRLFVRLLERRERLAALTQSGPSVGRYVQFEHENSGAAAQFRGLDWLSLLWNALERRLVVSFVYQDYANGARKQRLVEPGMLFEYKNRWYLDCYDLNSNGQRTFGLDRMTNLELTPQAIDPNRTIDYRAARQQVIGVTAPPGAVVERVVLRFAKPEAEYVRSLPLHHSQQEIEETDGFLTISLSVIINHELQREILAYGHEVEVLGPKRLRQEVATQCLKLADFYNDEKIHEKK
jgi:proteasome accessory factor B